MLIVQIAVQRLRKVVNFGTVDSVENDNTGDYDTKFVAQFSKHYADYQRTQTQSYQVSGTDLANTIIIAIRSTDKVDKALKAQFKNSEDVYDIVDISKGTTGKPVDYDLVTLKLQKGV